MSELETILLDLENELEEKGRKAVADDLKSSRLRLMGYLEGVQDMRLAVSRYFRTNKCKDIVQESEEEKDGYDTDLIREVVEMHKKVKALLLLFKQFDFLGGEKDVSQIFRKES